MNRSKLKAMLERYEDRCSKPYRCPAGKLTIGIGRNLDDVGLSDDEIDYLCENDIRRVERDLLRVVPSFGSLDDVRQRVLADMAFNLGVAGLLKFKKMLAAVAARAFQLAADEMKDSDWYKQVGHRGPELEQMMRSGADT